MVKIMTRRTDTPRREGAQRQPGSFSRSFEHERFHALHEQCLLPTAQNCSAIEL